MTCRERHEANTGENGSSKGRGRSGRLGLATAAVAVCSLLTAGAAQAATVTVGSVLPPGSTATKFEGVQTFFNTALPEKGANLVSPVNGAIIRWRMQDAKGGPFYLRVLHPNGTGAYAGAGTSNPATPSGTGLQTFTANLPVHAGDLIGVDPTNAGDEIGVAEVPGASYGFIFPPPFDGATVAPSGSVAGKELELSAEVQPTPAITSIAPNFGSIAGGTTVTITGTNLNSASAVKFGMVPAASFIAESETQITAVAPPSVTAGFVDVTATTIAGTSPLTKGDQFTYQACQVPKLKGKQLKSAKQALRRANCKLGTVRRKAHKRSNKVIKQSPKPGKQLIPGAKVNVTLGR